MRVSLIGDSVCHVTILNMYHLLRPEAVAKFGFTINCTTMLTRKRTKYDYGRKVIKIRWKIYTRSM